MEKAEDEKIEFVSKKEKICHEIYIYLLYYIIIIIIHYHYLY